MFGIFKRKKKPTRAEHRQALIALYTEQLNDYKAEAAPFEKPLFIELILEAALTMLNRSNSVHGKDPKKIEEWVVQTEKFWRKK